MPKPNNRCPVQYKLFCRLAISVMPFYSFMIKYIHYKIEVVRPAKLVRDVVVTIKALSIEKAMKGSRKRKVSVIGANM